MKIQTLKKRKDFILSNKFSKKQHSNNFILQKYKNPKVDDLCLRFGFTATKRIGNAVNRNRAKRRMKSLVIFFCKNSDISFECGNNYVLIAKVNLVKASFDSLKNEMKNCLNQL